jgi:hypothetical protein
MNIIEMQRLADMRGDNMASMVIQNFMESTQFFNRMEFVEFGGSFNYGWNEEKTLPTAGNRSINADYTASNGETKPMSEALKVVGGKVSFDRLAVQQLGNSIAMAKQESQIKAIRLKIMNDFFNGDSTSDALQYDGLKSFIPTTTAGQLERGYHVANGATALSRIKLDELIGNIDTEGNSTVIFADKMMPFYMRQYADTLLTFDKNEFGVPVARYGDIEIITVDRNNLNAKILGFTEASSTTSMFAVNLGVDKVAMLSGAGGLLSSPTVMSGSQDAYQMDWLLAVALQGKYNAGRISGITAATMTA